MKIDTQSQARRLAEYATPALVVGVIGLAIALVGLIIGVTTGTGRPFHGYLIGFGFWVSILFGMLMFTMLLYAFDAGWSTIIRRQLEHALAAFPWVALIFIPVVFLPLLTGNPGILWKWMDPNYVMPSGETVSGDILFIVKEAYLNVPFFIGRAIFYFAVFITLAHFLRKLSFANDQLADRENYRKARYVSAVGIILGGLVISFAAFDWFMSLEFHWFSTMYGVWYFSAGFRAAISASILLLIFHSTRGVLQGIGNQAHRYELARLAFAFTVFWMYISFSQYFLIYQANIPEVTFWYNIRIMDPITEDLNSWWWVLMSMVFLYFFFPFFFLLSYKNKITIKPLVFIAVWTLVFHLVDLYFNILPGKVSGADNVLGYTVRPFSIQVWDVAALVGIGGICAWAYLRSLGKTEVIPVNDPRILESVNYHE
jgi:hypothetical protein